MHKSVVFNRWLSRLRDRRAVARILLRIDRLASGNPGDTRAVGSGVSELRIDHGPGYRVYFLQDSDVTVLLLCGGDKSTQSQDIERAHRLADEWRDQNNDK